MSSKIKDVVHELTSTTGSGTLTLAGVPSSRQDLREFSEAFTLSGTNTFRYTITSETSNEFEVGFGHLSDSTTLVRDEIDVSSNANSPVNFSSGTKHIVSYPSASIIPDPRDGAADEVWTTDGTSGTWSSVSAGSRVFIPLTDIADTNNVVGGRMRIPTGDTLEILEIGVQDDTASAPSGLTIEVRDYTNSVNIVSQNTLYNSGSPIASKAGQIDVGFRVNNATGGAINASGWVKFQLV